MNVIRCDLCKAVPANVFKFTIGHEPDTAGDWYTVDKYLDICPECASIEYSEVLKTLSHGIQEQILNSLKARVSR